MFVYLHVCVGILSEIITGPSNTLIVRGRDDDAYMTCVGNETDKITWRYRSRYVINTRCTTSASYFAFAAERKSAYECNIRASLANASADPYIRAISGKYECGDRTDPATSLVIVLSKLLFCTAVLGILEQYKKH